MSRPAGSPFVADEVLDQLAAVAEAEEKATEALLGVDADHVPEDRPAADLHQRLGDRLAVPAQARAAPATEDHHVLHSGRAGAAALVEQPAGGGPELEGGPAGLEHDAQGALGACRSPTSGRGRPCRAGSGTGPRRRPRTG